ncbi:MAG: hypothetical protein AAFY09_13485, partial [Pseudomonadota bacterium]
LSLLLVFGLPVAVAWGIPKLVISSGANGSVEVITSQIVALLTGVIALQRAFSAWFTNRRTMGRRWRARSDLLTIIYEVQSKFGAGASKHAGKTSSRKFERALD